MTFVPYRLSAATAISSVPPIRGLERIDRFTTSYHGQRIIGKDIWCDAKDLADIHHNVSLEHSRLVVRGGPACGIYGANGFRAKYVDIVHISPPNDLTDYVQPPDFETLEEFKTSQGPPPAGIGGYTYDKIAYPEPVNAPYSAMQEGFTIHDADDVRLYGLRLFNLSVGIIAANSSNVRASKFEVHNARGPFYRGQAFQTDHCEDCIFEDFYLNNPLLDSWVEDTVSFYYSSRCIARRGLIIGNNAPLGQILMAESSSDCLFEDLDIIGWGNGAGTPYGFYDAGNDAPVTIGRNNTFRRVRARDGHYRSKRGNVASGVPFQSLGGTTGTKFYECVYWNIPVEAGFGLDGGDVIVALRDHNGTPALIQDPGSVDVADIREEDFTPRTWTPIQMPWQDWTEGPYAATLNIGPGLFKPDLDETVPPATFVGKFKGLSHDPDEEFEWEITEGGDKFEKLNDDEVWTTAPRFYWDDASINVNDFSRYNSLTVRCTGDRNGEWIERPCPVTINPIDEIGAGVFTGSVAGVVGSGGSLATDWTHDKSAGCTLEVLEANVLEHPLWTQKLKFTASPVLGERFFSLFYPKGIPSLPAEDGQNWLSRMYICRTDALSLYQCGITLIEHTAGGATVDYEVAGIGTGINTELFSPEARLTINRTLSGGPTVARVTGQLYVSFNFTADEVTAGIPKTQTIIIGGISLKRRDSFLWRDGGHILWRDGGRILLR